MVSPITYPVLGFVLLPVFCMIEPSTVSKKPGPGATNQQVTVGSVVVTTTDQ
jgi:hypothetical protein